MEASKSEIHRCQDVCKRYVAHQAPDLCYPHQRSASCKMQPSKIGSFCIHSKAHVHCFPKITPPCNALLLRQLAKFGCRDWQYHFIMLCELFPAHLDCYLIGLSLHEETYLALCGQRRRCSFHQVHSWTHKPLLCIMLRLCTMLQHILFNASRVCKCTAFEAV